MIIYYLYREENFRRKKKRFRGKKAKKKIIMQERVSHGRKPKFRVFSLFRFVITYKITWFWAVIYSVLTKAGKEHFGTVYTPRPHVNVFFFFFGRTRYHANIRRRIRFRTSIAADVPRTGIKDEQRLMTRSTAPMFPRCENEL